MMKVLLLISRAIDALNERIGRVADLARARDGAGERSQRAGALRSSTCSSNAWLEMQWYLFAAVFLLCAGYTLLHNEHIRIDVVCVAALAPHPDLDRHLRHALLPAADGVVIMWLSWPIFVDAWVEQRDVQQRRRPDPLAGAAAGSGRLLAAQRCRACPS